MKKIVLFIFVQLMFNFSVCNAQNVDKKNMNKDVKAMIQLGKDSIIQLALKSINKKVSEKNFSKTKITTNGKDVFVSFRNPIKYLPINSIFYFDVLVNVSKKTVYKNPVANPLEYSDKKNIPFYKETENIKKHILFVIEAINNMNISDIDRFEDDMIICEHKAYYAINVISKFQESFYKIKKISGEIYNEEHAHLLAPPFEMDDKEKFKNINFTEH